MNDDALNRGCIYKFLSNFYFLLLFPGFWHRSWWCRVAVSPLGREREAVLEQEDFLWHNTSPHNCTRALPHPPPLPAPILKMKNSNKQNKTKMKAQPHWMQQPGVWLVLTLAASPVCRKCLFYFLLEAISRVSITAMTKGRGKREGGTSWDEVSKATRSFCQHLGRLTLGSRPTAGCRQWERLQGGSTLEMPRNVVKL